MALRSPELPGMNVLKRSILVFAGWTWVMRMFLRALSGRTFLIVW